MTKPVFGEPEQIISEIITFSELVALQELLSSQETKLVITNEQRYLLRVAVSVLLDFSKDCTIEGIRKI